MGGDPLSELSIRRRIKSLKRSKSISKGIVFIPESWAKADPALQWGVQNLDWLKIEKPPV